MNRKWLSLCLLALLALLASAAWWWLAHDDWQPPAAQQPQLPEVQALPAPEAVAMRQALARPLLWSSRRPPDALSAAQLDAGGTDQDGDLKDTTLEAVLESGGQRLALLRTGENKILKVGADPAKVHNAVPNWRLEQFDGTTAVFKSNDGQRVERALVHTETPSPKARAAEAASQSVRRARSSARATDDNSLPASRDGDSAEADNEGTSGK